MEEWLEVEESVKKAAEKMGLSADSEYEREVTVSKDERDLGQLVWMPEQEEAGGWYSRPPAPGVSDTHSTLKDGLKVLAQNAKKLHFLVAFEFATDVDVDKDTYRAMEEFLAEVAFAFRHRFTPEGAKFKKVKVGAMTERGV